jgi:hypothetical protein
LIFHPYCRACNDDVTWWWLQASSPLLLSGSYN